VIDGLVEAHDETRTPSPCTPRRLHFRLARRDVAQSGSALQWGCRGRGFKSRRPDSCWADLRVGLVVGTRPSTFPESACVLSPCFPFSPASRAARADTLAPAPGASAPSSAWTRRR